MSKIVIDAREWSASSGRYISSLVRHLEKTDSQHDYSILLKPRDMAAWIPVNRRFYKVECAYKEFTLSEQLGFKKLLDGLGADLVHFPMVQQPVRYRGKTVTTMNDLTTARFDNPSKNRLVFKSKQQIYKWLNRRVARQTDAILTFTEYVKNDVAEFAGIGTDKMTVTPLAADPIEDEPIALPDLVGQQFIMYVGRPTPHKNLERLIEAFALLKPAHPGLHLVLAGKKDVNYRRIGKAVSKKGIQDVGLTGFVSEGQLRWLYENCAAYVFPSLSEGFGLPGLEAMVHGAPVVSSNATCLPEVYSQAAHYFDPLDVPAMAAAINQVLTDKELRGDLIGKGKRQAAKYSWQRTAEQTLAVYNRVLSS